MINDKIQLPILITRWKTHQMDLWQSCQHGQQAGPYQSTAFVDQTSHKIVLSPVYAPPSPKIYLGHIISYSFARKTMLTIVNKFVQV